MAVPDVEVEAEVCALNLEHMWFGFESSRRYTLLRARRIRQPSKATPNDSTMC